MAPTHATPRVDVAGIGNNATDTILRLPRFPSPDSKTEILSAEVMPGGQVASALVACRRWGLSARYVGKIGDDDAGGLQIREMQREGIEAHWIIVKNCASQSAYILVDESSGERTVLWQRNPRIALLPEDLRTEWVLGARILLIDGHDTAAAAQGARWARQNGILVVGDFDNCYPGIEVLLQYVDFPVTSKDFPERLTGEKDLLKSLPEIFRRFRPRLVAATLGRFGVLAWDGSHFQYHPGFQVRVLDTTGAGDVFHGAFVFGLVQSWPMDEIIEFSCAAAAMNCQAHGARGGISSLDNIALLRATAPRSDLAYSPEELQQAARTVATAANHP